jgi:ElaB/YqjD/DUF883 family membrane-anchored ribosome-binding protein
MKTKQEATMNTTDKVSNFAHETVDTIANASNQAREAFADATHQVRETMDEKSDQFINAEQRLVKNCQGYIRDNPITSLGIAVASGFLLSRLLSRGR